MNKKSEQLLAVIFSGIHMLKSYNREICTQFLSLKNTTVNYENIVDNNKKTAKKSSGSVHIIYFNMCALCQCDEAHVKKVVNNCLLLFYRI